MKALKRCHWSGEDPAMVRYHDEEWGVPVHDERRLFEFLTLEGAQAGLSWSTVLRKRDAYREAFAGFEPARVARMTAKDRARLLKNEGLIRNRAKIESTVKNAQAFLEIQKEFGSFDAYLWKHVAGKPVQGKRRGMGDIPARSPLADALSKDLKKRGFGFVGPTIVYALLQAVGVVNDHLTTCFRYEELARAR
ncbi:MAG TPA: DNA-3-methyladenine glycosylase I [Polyangiaceae bacterium]|nr:DNA-3-methyladenine glycosylase I [Polyangiaceae bacterium]